MGFLQKLFSDLPDATVEDTTADQPQARQQPVDGAKQQQIVDASFQRLVIMFISRLMMFHSDKTGEELIKERFFINFPTVIDERSFKEAMTTKFTKELPGSQVKLFQQDTHSWDVTIQAPINIPALVEKHLPLFNSKIDVTSFNIVNGLNPIPPYLNNPNFQMVQDWINLVELTIVDNLKPLGKPFSFLANRELQVHCKTEFPPQAIIPVERHFSADGLICKIIDNRDVMKGQLITLLFTPEEPDFNLPQLNGSSSRHDDQHVLETSYVEVAN
jgi:hypothetical protein